MKQNIILLILCGLSTIMFNSCGSTNSDNNNAEDKVECCRSCSGAGIIDKDCPRCYGNGKVYCPYCNGTRSRNCSDCNGSGVVTVYRTTTQNSDCSYCYGFGIAKCDRCNGAGRTVCPGCHGVKTTCIRCGGDCVDIIGGQVIVCLVCKGAGVLTCPICNNTGYYKCENCDGGTRPANCRHCFGTGKSGKVQTTSQFVEETCDECRGRGSELCTFCDRGYVICIDCQGEGSIKETCINCRGKGKL